MADDPTTPSVPPVTLPPEPDPVPVAPPKSEEPVVPPPPPMPSLDPTPAPSPAPKPEDVVESILETKNPESVIVPPVSPQHHNAGPKKTSKGPLILLVALLLLVLPISVYFISQQNQEIADTRSKAWGTGYKQCGGATDGNPRGDCPPGYVCHCQDGDMCTETRCELPGETETPCLNQGRAWCANQHGVGMTCCVPGYVCNPNGDGCVPGGGGGDDDGGDDDDDTPNPTATPTTGVNPVCQNIKIYKDGTQVTDLTTLRAGDEVVLAVKGNLSPTKAHFRVNGGAWTETTTKNANNEFTRSYTIPEGITDFVIEGEVFTNGAWR